MAKYILMEFDDNAEADAFAQMTAQGSSVRVKAIFQKPTQFCTCPNPGDRSVRGKKYGWWVHRDCGKPKRGVWQGPRNFLDPEDIKPADKLINLTVREGYGRTPD